jgi:hypothetical protein
MHHQGANIDSALAERWNMQVDDLEPIQKVFTKLTRSQHFSEVLVGRRHDANVDCSRRVTAHGLNFTVLQKAEQQCLHAQAHLADFVEEECTAMCEQELTDLVAKCAGETPFHVSE